MTPTTEIDTLTATDRHRSEIVQAYAKAFGFSPESSELYIEQVGLENFRVSEARGRTAAVTALIPTAHWIGGKPVSAVNIAHVAVDPVWRGAGLAGRFLESVCHEAARSGAALATLFASTRPVYRRAGFALAGIEAVYEAQTSCLPRVHGALFRHLDADTAISEILPIYRRSCEEDAGLLERAPAHWQGLLSGSTSTYVNDTRGAEGYIILDTRDPECLIIRDWAALTGLAAAHLLTLVGTFKSVYPLVRWHGSPHDKLIFALPDKGWRLAHQEEWLARVLDPVAAFQQRGYVADECLGIDLVGGGRDFRYCLSVAGGQTICDTRKSDVPTIRVAYGDLGTLLTGHRSASFLARAGVISGDTEALRRCDLLFSGPPPWVAEHF